MGKYVRNVFNNRYLRDQMMGAAATLSTGQAAKLCSVTPDAVLKWIHQGRIAASRTAGGHFRINRTDLMPFLKSQAHGSSDRVESLDSANMRCWDYFGNKGKSAHECSKCIVWKSKAERCYVVAADGKTNGYAGLLCNCDCESCDYFAFVSKTQFKVLAFTSDMAVRESVGKERHPNFQFTFVNCGYELGSLVHGSKVDIVVIDDSIECCEVTRLIESLLRDSRNQSTLIVLGSSGKRKDADFSKLPVKTVDLHNLTADLESMVYQKSPVA